MTRRFCYVPILVGLTLSLAGYGCSFEERTAAANPAPDAAAGALRDASMVESDAPVAATIKYDGFIDVESLDAQGQFGYTIRYDFGTPADESTGTDTSTLKLFEDGVMLGPAHSYHDDIRQKGAGAYSHWFENLYFSTSDNTDPRTNGRVYGFVRDEVVYE